MLLRRRKKKNFNKQEIIWSVWIYQLYLFNMWSIQQWHPENERPKAILMVKQKHQLIYINCDLEFLSRVTKMEACLEELQHRKTEGSKPKWRGKGLNWMDRVLLFHWLQRAWWLKNELLAQMKQGKKNFLFIKKKKIKPWIHAQGNFPEKPKKKNFLKFEKCSIISQHLLRHL